MHARQSVCDDDGSIGLIDLQDGCCSNSASERSDRLIIDDDEETRDVTLVTRTEGEDGDLTTGDARRVTDADIAAEDSARITNADPQYWYVYTY